MKSNQKSSQKRGFSAAQGFCPAGQVKTTGCIIFAPHAPPNTHGKKKLCPLPSLNTSSFYLTSPEAYFLTSTERKNPLIRRIMVQTKNA
ncbi:MAG: hypothetical protein V4619_07120 [Bacteroidota bacterium]